jgi:hypothetical protein
MSGPTEARFGPIYDDGSGRRGGYHGPEAAAPHRAEPTPAAPPARPAEELPMGEPTSSMSHVEFGNAVSYREPMEPRRLPGRSMRPSYDGGGYGEPVDSPRPSRKLGKPRPARYAR